MFEIFDMLTYLNKFLGKSGMKISLQLNFFHLFRIFKRWKQTKLINNWFML